MIEVDENGQRRVRVKAIKRNGKDKAVTAADVAWTTTVGSLAAPDADGSVVFTAPNSPSAGEIRVDAFGLSATDSVTVVESPVASLEITSEAV